MKILSMLFFIVTSMVTYVNAFSLPAFNSGDAEIDNPVSEFTRKTSTEARDEDVGFDQTDPRCAKKAIGTLTTTATTIELGQSIALSWSVQLPTEYDCQNVSLTLADKPVAQEGFQIISPKYSKYYPLTVDGVQLANIFIEVRLINSVIYIEGNTEEWAGLLRQAVGEVGKTVILKANVDLEIPFSSPIYVARGVTLTSEPQQISYPTKIPTTEITLSNISKFSPLELSNVTTLPVIKNPIAVTEFQLIETPSARDARHPGPRLYTRAHPRPLFHILCTATDGDDGSGDNVRINGFRLIGPDINETVGSDWKDRAIQITGCKNIEISNMELAGWSGQSIYIQDISDVAQPGRLTTPTQVSIHDNYFHHNQQKTGGDGYGIEVKHGAYALIERNVFDFNRHAIAAGGEEGTGYTARFNLVLPGGGYHKWEDPLDGPLDVDISWHTHQFDVHGTDHCGPQSLFSDALYNCGQAGEIFEMSHNAFQYTRGYAIKIRGIPSVGASIAQNVFAHSSESDAIKEWGPEGFSHINRTDAFANRFGINTSGEYGVCDFDGDKKDDLFLATGTSWWFMSGANQHWVFLNISTERLAQLGLGDFDGDHICDVFSVHGNDFGMHKSGKEAWKSLGTFFVPSHELRYADFNGDGIQDIFRRAPDGQWWIISPGYYDWIPIQRSSFALTALRFGDFNGDRVADVIAVEDGHWSISWSGRERWAPLNRQLSTSLKNVLIADLDGNGIDDIARYAPENLTQGKWEVSWNGQTDWLLLARLHWPIATTSTSFIPTFAASTVTGYVGRFNGAAASNLLSVDYTRLGKMWNPSSPEGFVVYGRYAY